MKIGKRKELAGILMKSEDKKNNVTRFFTPSDLYYACDNGEIEGKSGFPKSVKENGEYLQTTIQDTNGEPHLMLVHRLIAYAYLMKTPERNEVHHAGDKKDNRPSQLVWASPEEHDKLDKLKKTNRREHRKLFNAIRKDNRERGKYGE